MAILSSPLSLIQSIPPVTRSFTAATVVSSLLYIWLRWNGSGPLPYVTMIPGLSIFYPWTILTSALVETDILQLVATLIFIPASLKYFERLWGSVETLKFIIVAIGISNVIALAFNWIEYFATGNDTLFLYGMEYHGQMALQIAVLVAFTQLIPEHQVQVFGVFKARVKALPMAYLTLSTVLCILGFQCPWIIIQFGWFVGWVYLRFYKKNTADTAGGIDSYGDRSETFSLVSWFPPFLHAPLSKLGNFVYHYANRFHLIPRGHDIESGGYAPLPTRAEAERRRALALKALDQRLASGAQSPTPGSSQTSRPANAVASSSASPSPPAPPRNERQKSASQVDLEEPGNGKSESRLP
ncbi:hypothetical protein AX16_000501 [Volvariella volvacea WC 439]|uniref:Putative PDUPA2 n=1 Tax=Volvariella volvacea TaxID=36659 RepID=H6VLD4_9AGAR|nr:putative PDUPA2 [Volvariella volvacea]KAF8665485.1 hypothetical protein AX16_000501 [Volvariella volvacea WC 439]